jgi:hypothetical protein
MEQGGPSEQSCGSETGYADGVGMKMTFAKCAHTGPLSRVESHHGMNECLVTVGCTIGCTMHSATPGREVLRGTLRCTANVGCVVTSWETEEFFALSPLQHKRENGLTCWQPNQQMRTGLPMQHRDGTEEKRSSRRKKRRRRADSEQISYSSLCAAQDSCSLLPCCPTRAPANKTRALEWN